MHNKAFPNGSYLSHSNFKASSLMVTKMVYFILFLCDKIKDRAAATLIAQQRAQQQQEQRAC